MLVCKLEEDKFMSWLASGDASANYSIDSSGLSMTLDDTHQEIDFFQDRSSFTSLFKGWHLIENFFAKLKQYRGIATRYDKRACAFLGAIHWVAAVIWLN